MDMGNGYSAIYGQLKECHGSGLDVNTGETDRFIPAEPTKYFAQREQICILKYRKILSSQWILWREKCRNVCKIIGSEQMNPAGQKCEIPKKRENAWIFIFLTGDAKRNGKMTEDNEK